MSYYSTELEQQARILGLDLDLLPLQIFLVTGTMFSGVFLDKETDDLLVCNITREDLCEELHIIPKDNVEFIKIQYESAKEDKDGGECNDRIYG